MDNCHCILILVRFWCWKKVRFKLLALCRGKEGGFFPPGNLKMLPMFGDTFASCKLPSAFSTDYEDRVVIIVMP